MKTSLARVSTAAVIIAAMCRFSATAHGEEVTVMTSGGFAAPFLALIEPFERATGRTAVAVTTSVGVGADAISSRIRRGEPDVVVLSTIALPAACT